MKTDRNRTKILLGLAEFGRDQRRERTVAELRSMVDRELLGIRKTETLRSSTPAIARKIGSAFVEIDESAVEIAQRGLQTVRGNFLEPGQFGFEGRKLILLGDVANRAPAPGEFFTLLESEVVDEAASAGDLPKDGFLGRRRVDAIADCRAAKHVFCLLGLRCYVNIKHE